MRENESPSAPIHPVILSGGSGTRLWPVSRSLYPKQLLPLAAKHTMLQETARRFAGRAEYGPPLIVCNDAHRFIVAEQLRALDIVPQDILLEPVGRNTAPAVAAAALVLLESDPAALILGLPSDHVIGDMDAPRPAYILASVATQTNFSKPIHDGWQLRATTKSEHKVDRPLSFYELLRTIFHEA